MYIRCRLTVCRLSQHAISTPSKCKRPIGRFGCRVQVLHSRRHPPSSRSPSFWRSALINCVLCNPPTSPLLFVSCGFFVNCSCLVLLFYDEMKHIAEAAWVLAFASSFAAAQSPVGAEVQTSSGIVTGHAAPNKTTVSEYLGIPYAQPPLGRLRFAAPLAFNSSQPFDASSYSPDCPQIGLTSPPIKYPNQTTQFSAIISAFGGGRGNPQSEDCLTLNIWTKRPGSRNKTGVLVWIHGGRFTLGNTNTPFYQGQYIVESEDIVFVSINYRTNIFGFSGAPSEPQNAGLLDQRMAIEWVRDNIAGFGGDPERISIMGQSAGGSAVDFYAYAHTTDPIVAGLISVSGTALSFLPNTPDFSHQSFLAAAASVGCTGSDEDLVVACMRQVEFKILLNATRSVKPLPSAALIQPVFHPTVDNKTVFTRQDYLAKGQAGEFARIVSLTNFLFFSSSSLVHTFLF